MIKRQTLRIFMAPFTLLALLNVACASKPPSVTPLTGRIIFGKVTSVNGSDITLGLGTLVLQSGKSTPGSSFEPNGDVMTISITNPSNLKKQQNGSKGHSQETPDQSPQSSGSSQNSPSSSQSPQSSLAPSGGKNPSPELTVEVPATRSDIIVGSVLRITYQGGEIMSITILLL